VNGSGLESDPLTDAPNETAFRKTLIGVALAALSSSALAQSAAENPTTPPPAHEKQAPGVEAHLKTFDTLDFDVFSNQKWTGSMRAVPRTSS